VAAPNFSQSERRSLAVPIVIAVVILAAAAALILHHLPSHNADLTITHIDTWQSHIVFKSDSTIVGRDKAQDDLYVLATLRIDNRLHIPIFLKDITATFTTPSGDLLSTSSVEQSELAPLYQTFPALKARSSAPLLRESTIAPGHPAEGMVLLHFPTTQADWDHRQSATLTIDLYHQPPITINFAKP
jgi:hypothetical protein